MFLIADSGSTKCTWTLAGPSGVTEWRTRGLNAIHSTSEQIREVLAEVPACGAVGAVYFYGAGCGRQFPEATELLRQELRIRFQALQISVESDLCGAARALFAGGEGIACILGTGSNSCLCRGGEVVQNTPPLGYILGDEGSGSALGKGLLNGVFKGHIPLRDEVLAFCGMTYEQIIHRVYAEPYANRFLASFAPFVLAHLEYPQVAAMVQRCFRDFAERNLSAYPAGLPLGFVGGVAANFAGLLREELHEYDIRTIVESPAEGLLKYHYGT